MSPVGDWPAEPVWMTLPLGRVRVLDTGPRDAPAVFFVHGLSYPLEVWHPLSRTLRTAGYRCVCYDLYGRGSSSYRGGALSTATLAQQALAVMDQHQVDRAHVVTLSNGDLITLSLGVQAPQRLRSLSLIAPSGWDRRTMNPSMRLVCRTPGASRVFGEVLRRRLAQRMRDHASHLPPSAPESAARVYDLAIEAVLGNPDFAAAATSQIGHQPTREGLRDLVKRFAATHVTTRMIHYGEEQDATPEGTEVLRRGLPHATERVLAHGGHMGLLEYPEALGRVLLEGFQADP